MFPSCKNSNLTVLAVAFSFQQNKAQNLQSEQATTMAKNNNNNNFNPQSTVQINKENVNSSQNTK